MRQRWAARADAASPPGDEHAPPRVRDQDGSGRCSGPGCLRRRLQTPSTTAARVTIPTSAQNARRSSLTVSIVKTTRTAPEERIAARITHALAASSRRRRNAATPTSTNTASETALPIETSAPRLNTLTKRSVKTVVISSRPFLPNLDCRPNIGGNWPTSASAEVRPDDAYKVAVTDDDVARSAAITIAT